MDVEQIAKVYAQLDPPLWLVTAADAGRRGGFVATTVTYASIVDAMPRQLITVNKRHNTYPMIEASGALAMHLIDETQFDLVWRFGTSIGPRRRQVRRGAVPYRRDRKPTAARSAGLARLPGGNANGLGRPHHLPGRCRRWSTGTNRAAPDEPSVLRDRPAGEADDHGRTVRTRLRVSTPWRSSGTARHEFRERHSLSVHRDGMSHGGKNRN